FIRPEVATRRALLAAEGKVLGSPAREKTECGTYGQTECWHGRFWDRNPFDGMGRNVFIKCNTKDITICIDRISLGTVAITRVKKECGREKWLQADGGCGRSTPTECVSCPGSCTADSMAHLLHAVGAYGHRRAEEAQNRWIQVYSGARCAIP